MSSHRAAREGGRTLKTLTSIASASPDTIQLAEVAKELAKPLVVATKRFGDLTLDRSINWFEGEVKWNGESVRIIFHADGNQDISAGQKVAEKLWTNK